MDKIPNHIAIIMDGNGRWAEKRGLNRSLGHLEGSRTLKKITKYLFSKQVKVLSVFAFSTENFKRDKEEVDYLMNLFIKIFSKEFKFLKENNIKVIFSGRTDNLDEKVVLAMNKMVLETKDLTNGIFNICLNYGGQEEIIDAALKIHDAINNNELNKNEIDKETFYKYLYNDIPPIDLLIRTSGEYRISNFMLYQMAYAELHFTNTYFPDLNKTELNQIIDDFKKRDRRFGGVNKKESQ